eukprot:m.199869 g.199869  ORF g.199869 m.199869 type:complete len:436 (-) comp17687_c0_seq5:496-1803(-)
MDWEEDKERDDNRVAASQPLNQLDLLEHLGKLLLFRLLTLLHCQLDPLQRLFHSRILFVKRCARGKIGERLVIVLQMLVRRRAAEKSLHRLAVQSKGFRALAHGFGPSLALDVAEGQVQVERQREIVDLRALIRRHVKSLVSVCKRPHIPLNGVADVASLEQLGGLGLVLLHQADALRGLQLARVVVFFVLRLLSLPLLAVLLEHLVHLAARRRNGLVERAVEGLHRCAQLSKLVCIHGRRLGLYRLVAVEPLLCRFQHRAGLSHVKEVGMHALAAGVLCFENESLHLVAQLIDLNPGVVLGLHANLQVTSSRQSLRPQPLTHRLALLLVVVCAAASRVAARKGRTEGHGRGWIQRVCALCFTKELVHNALDHHYAAAAAKHLHTRDAVAVVANSLQEHLPQRRHQVFAARLKLLTRYVQHIVVVVGKVFKHHVV